MNKIIILGLGGHSKVVEDSLIDSNLGKDIAYLDDDNEKIEENEKSKLGKNLLGKLNLIYNHKIKEQYTFGFVAIANPEIRMEWIKRLIDNGFKVPVIIHPTAWVSRSAILGDGSLVLSQATVQAEVICGKGTIINNCASIDHDSILKDGVHISPGANIAGNVEIGKESWIGIGASVIQGIKIGANTKIGANAAVINDIPDGVTAAGVPAKIIKYKNS